MFINLPVSLRSDFVTKGSLDRLVYRSAELPGVPAGSPGHTEVFPQPVHKHESLQEKRKGGIRED